MKYGPDKWDERYGVDEYVYGKEPNLFLKQNYKVIPKGDVLCVADGEGRNGVWLAKQGYSVTSIDFSPKAIEKINSLAKRNNVSIKTICDDLLDYKFGQNKYDGIVSIFAHFKIEEINKLHHKYFNALKSKGVFLTEVFAKEQLPLKTGGPKDILLLYDTQDIQDSFPTGKIELLKKDVVYLHEGDMHEGKAVVVRAIIRKPSDKEN
ncbi:MAG: class I SAM-dependent methyltransferase [Candidatus Marinimicrobia bacterium]|nr:class I SAM-dependent methyltransferase [Candidatus Neomarinimicrobiota bacterium]